MKKRLLLSLALCSVVLLHASCQEPHPAKRCTDDNDCFVGEVCSMERSCVDAPILIEPTPPECDVAPCENDHTLEIGCVAKRCEAFSCKSDAIFCGDTCCPAPQAPTATAPPQSDTFVIEHEASGEVVSEQRPMRLSFHPIDKTPHLWSLDPARGEVNETFWQHDHWETRRHIFFPQPSVAFDVMYDEDASVHIAYTSSWRAGIYIATSRDMSQWQTQEISPPLESDIGLDDLQPYEVSFVDGSTSQLAALYTTTRIFSDPVLKSQQSTLKSTLFSRTNQSEWLTQDCLSLQANERFFRAIHWAKEDEGAFCSVFRSPINDKGYYTELDTLYLAAYLSVLQEAEVTQDEALIVPGVNLLWYRHLNLSSLHVVASSTPGQGELVHTTYNVSNLDTATRVPVMTGLKHLEYGNPLNESIIASRVWRLTMPGDATSVWTFAEVLNYDTGKVELFFLGRGDDEKVRTSATPLAHDPSLALLSGSSTFFLALGDEALHVIMYNEEDNDKLDYRRIPLNTLVEAP